jgi:hypothetical protein
LRSNVIGFCNKCLFISNQSQIYVLNTQDIEPYVVSNEFKEGKRKLYTIDLGPVINHAMSIKAQEDIKTEEEEKKNSNLRKKNTTMVARQKSYKLEDIRYVIIACETSDNQIDFSTLTFK